MATSKRAELVNELIKQATAPLRLVITYTPRRRHPRVKCTRCGKYLPSVNSAIFHVIEDHPEAFGARRRQP